TQDGDQMTLALYGKSRRRQATLLVAALVALFAAIAGGVLITGANVESQRAFAHGNDSPSACEASGVGNLGVSDGATEGIVNAPAGKVVDWLCIKSGNSAFGDKQHSGKITSDGTYGDNGCFIVEGLGTATA